MVIISVDYGDVRTGVAACDKLQLLASPVTVIKQKDPELLSEDGSEGFRAEACKEFAKLLSEKTGLSVDFQDERLTTVSAHNILNATDTRGKKRKAVVDAVSAVLILEDYLRKQN